MSIKLGNLNVESFKVGSGDCSIYLGTTLLYSGGTPPAPHDYSQDYLTFRALEDGTFKFSGNSINYSLDDGATWTELASDTDSPTVNSGDTILWKASLRASSKGIGRFSSSGRFEVEGNTMSLKFSDNFSGQTTLSDSNSLRNLFSGCSGVTSAENMVLPATTLAESCYRTMFRRCTSLTTTPNLPATTLADYCYSYMFGNCSSLNTAPALLATTLTNNCYSDMFINCTSLTTAPSLPATTLASNCYYAMFWGCTSLTTAPALPATTLAEWCYSDMFYNCTSLTTAPTISATTLGYSCCSSMFAYCTSLTTAPNLPATTLAQYCYYRMFLNCVNLSSITCLATDISSLYCTKDWVSGVASSGTFYKHPSMTSWGSGSSGIPNNWTVQDYSS